MALISRGFGRRDRVDAPPERVPPGQYVTSDFPVLSAGPTPRIDTAGWEFVLTADLPGMDPDDVELACEGDMITISGEKRIVPHVAGAARVLVPVGRLRGRRSGAEEPDR